MSEQGVTTAQKLFAIVDNWVRNLHIREWDVSVASAVADLPLLMRAHMRTLDYAMNAVTAELPPLETMTAVTDGLREFARPVVNEAGLDQLATTVHREDLRWTVTTAATDVSCLFVAGVHDFGRAFSSGTIHYEVKTREFPFRDLTISVSALALVVPAVIREQTAVVLRLPIRRAPLQLSFLSQGEQLSFWKAAIRQTKRTARDLRLVGVYPAVPMGLTEGMRIDSQHGDLLFQPTGGGTNRSNRLQDVAIFQDLIADRVVIVTP